MTFLCLEPVINSGKLSAFTTFSDEGQFMFHRIAQQNDPATDRYFSEKFSYFCFSAFKTLSEFGDKVDFLWDVEILYELLGHKFNGLIGLGKEILGAGRVTKYFKLSERTKAHIKSYQVSHIDIGAYQILQLLPADLVHDLYIERAKIIMDLFLKVSEEDKQFYREFFDSVKMLYQFSKIPLDIDLGSISSNFDHHADMIRRNTKNKKAYLKFKPVGAKTGRLGFEKGSLNLYTLPKEMRSCIVAPGDSYFVELDFKASQPRIAIASTGNEDFIDLARDIEDVYSIFPGDREKIKIGFLAWMFGKTRIPGSIYEQYAWPIWELRNQLAKKSSEDGYLETRFGRRLYNHGEDKHVIFQNFITATEVDFILGLCRRLSDMGVRIRFPYHDAVLCETESLERVGRIREICERHFEDIFRMSGQVGVKIGKNFGSMNAI